MAESEGVALDFRRPVIESNAHAIDGVGLLDEMTAFIKRYVRLTDAEAWIVAAWVAHTHAISAARETPYLRIHSAEKQCGKTRLLEVLELLVSKPWLTGRVTAACLVRKVDQVRPTLLLDESDAAFNGEKGYAEALRGILNTGHREDGKASCCVGQGANVTCKDFKTFCPKAIAGIGKNLPDTVLDRSIPIALKRKARGESVHRFRRRDVKPEADQLKSRLADWLQPLISQLREARPALPDELSDRRQDGLEPLLAIAEAAGGPWPQRMREAATTVFSTQAADDASIGVQLLADVRSIFNGCEKIATSDLLQGLKEIETSPWADWNHGKGLTPAGLSKLLRPFEIAPGTVRLDEGRTAKGYSRQNFNDAWNRYLGSGTPIDNAQRARGDLAAVTASQPASLLPENEFSARHREPDVTAPNSVPGPHKHCIVTDVTATKPDQTPGVKSGEDETDKKSSLPACAKCGSFALYRLPTGSLECLTCAAAEEV